jgi:type III secretion protein R
LVIVLGALSLALFVLIMLTSFVKVSVVLSILRNTRHPTGTTQPGDHGLGVADHLHHGPGRQMYQAAGNIANTRDIFSEASVKGLFDAGKPGKEPLRKFLAKHSHSKDRVLFMELATKLDQGSSPRAPVDKGDFHVMIPAFVTGELKEAFQIGFLVFAAFMVVANILLSMGMHMLSPSVISLPFCCLFILVDGS